MSPALNTGYSLLINVHEKILPSFSSCRIQTCMCLTSPLKKKVALACNSYYCLGGRSRQFDSCVCSTLTVHVRSTDFGIGYFLLEEHLTVYYTVFEFYEDRHRAARRVFTAQRTERCSQTELGVCTLNVSVRRPNSAFALRTWAFAERT